MKAITDKRRITRPNSWGLNDTYTEYTLLIREDDVGRVLPNYLTHGGARFLVTPAEINSKVILAEDDNGRSCFRFAALDPIKLVVQFGYIYNQPLPDNLPVIDCRVLPNVYKRGWTDAALKEEVRKLEGFPALVEAGLRLLDTHDQVWVGCLYGVHRSGAVAEELVRQTGGILRKVHG